ncbi:hypothetical protein CR513_20003, partial [Mucuna pruriens]
MAFKIINLYIFLTIVCIAFVLASGRATMGSSWLYCMTSGEGHCPDIGACNQYCLSTRFPGGGVCKGNLCCCKA